jgi:hypothetical protein
LLNIFFLQGGENMAVTATQRRLVGLELQANVTEFKTALDAINTVTAAWTLDEADENLPTAAAVQAQLAAFDALSKPTNNINDALAEIRAYTP